MPDENFERRGRSGLPTRKVGRIRTANRVETAPAPFAAAFSPVVMFAAGKAESVERFLLRLGFR